MDIVVTLICNWENRIDGALLARARAAAPADWSFNGARSLSAAGEAVDLAFAGPPADFRAIADDIRAGLSGAAVDAVAQPASGRKKRLLVTDMDSTIIEQECIDELAEFAGKRAEISTITERAMRGELDFEAALKERIAMLKGLPEKVLEETFAKRITLTPGALALTRTMKRDGATIALVSGGFTFFTGRVAKLAGFDRHDANELGIAGGALDGTVREPIRGRAAKEAALISIASELGISLDQTMAAGDGANDLSMLERAGMGVAFRAKPKVAAAARARIDYGDLTALLYIQGFHASEFVR